MLLQYVQPLVLAMDDITLPSKNNYGVPVDSDEYRKIQEEYAASVKMSKKIAELETVLKEKLSAKDYNSIQDRDDSIVIYYTNKTNVEKAVEKIDTDIKISYEKATIQKINLKNV